jgi:hypothetical protein
VKISYIKTNLLPSLNILIYILYICVCSCILLYYCIVMSIYQSNNSFPFITFDEISLNNSSLLLLSLSHLIKKCTSSSISLAEQFLHKLSFLEYTFYIFVYVHTYYFTIVLLCLSINQTTLSPLYMYL